MFMSRRMRYSGYVALIGEKSNAYKFFGAKTRRKMLRTR
jgi:hypothetical protein